MTNRQLKTTHQQKSGSVVGEGKKDKDDTVRDGVMVSGGWWLCVLSG